MNWKEQFAEIEKTFGVHAKLDWKPATALARKVIADHPNDVEAYVRVIYLLHNIVLEEETINSEHNYMAGLLKQYFDESQKKFSDNTEYLFFIGKILWIAEWYFGQDDDKLGMEMQKKAVELEPNNILYEWAYRLSVKGDVVHEYLACRIITNETSIVNWLKSKGFPGEYVLEHLEVSKKRYEENTSQKLRAAD
ncbi:MAG: hypothetical protein IAF08_13260 [Rhizobacter sp.]|nr:hypothetical protein [Chlorobiales bacterium]